MEKDFIEDFIRELGYKAIDSRFKRISDRMSHDIRKLYKELNVDIEPNWYLIFMLLRDHQKLTIADIAERLGYAHPSVVIIIKKMTSKGFIQTSKDESDKRKQIIALTDKSLELLPELELLWKSCDNAIMQMLDEDLNIMAYLDKLDEALKNRSFHDRYKNEYLKNK